MWSVTYRGPGGMKADDLRADWTDAMNMCRLLIEAASPEFGYPAIINSMRSAAPLCPWMDRAGLHVFMVRREQELEPEFGPGMFG